MTRHYSYAISDLTDKLDAFFNELHRSDDPKPRFLVAKAMEFKSLLMKFYHHNLDEELKFQVYEFRRGEVESRIYSLTQQLSTAQQELITLNNESISHDTATS